MGYSMADDIRPHDVRHDTALSIGARLLWSEVRDLAAKEGYCWASSTYLAGSLGVSARTIRGWLSELVGAKYLVRQVVDKTRRKLWIGRKQVAGGRKHTSYLGGSEVGSTDPTLGSTLPQVGSTDPRGRKHRSGGVGSTDPTEEEEEDLNKDLNQSERHRGQHSKTTKGMDDDIDLALDSITDYDRAKPIETFWALEQHLSSKGFLVSASMDKLATLEGLLPISVEERSHADCECLSRGANTPSYWSKVLQTYRNRPSSGLPKKPASNADNMADLKRQFLEGR